MSTLTWLRVHTLRTTEGDATRVAQQAYCPQRKRYVPLGTCGNCARLFAVDHRDRDTYLICDVPDGSSAPVEEMVKQAPPDAREEAPAIVADAMHADVVCVEPQASLERLLGLLASHGISGLPVVKDGNSVGVVSKSDVVRALSNALAAGRTRSLADLTVGDVMSPLVFSVTPDTSLERAAALMAYEGVHRVPVVADGQVVGMLSSMDVLRWVARRKGFVIPEPTPGT